MKLRPVQLGVHPDVRHRPASQPGSASQPCVASQPRVASQPGRHLTHQHQPRNAIAAAAFTLLLSFAAPRPAAAGILLDHHRKASKLNVEALEDQWRAAQLADDTAAMDRLLSDDFIGITASGQVLTKIQQLDRMRTRTTLIRSMDVTDTKVKIEGRVAIVTSTAHIVGDNNGAPVDGTFRYTRIYARNPAGVWKITSFEATRVPSGKQQARTTPQPPTSDDSAHR